MKFLKFSSLKYIIAPPVTLLLFLSLLSASFYDPTFFHQLYPVAGIQNWCGIPGALLGGTLIELFGPSALLVPWFVLKLSFSAQNYLHRISTAYYAVTLMLSISVAHHLWSPVSLTELSNSGFIGYPGYAGILGAQWLQETLGSDITNILTGAIVVFCTVRLFDELPFKMLFSAVLYISFSLPSYLLQRLCRPLIPKIFYTLTSHFPWLKPQLPLTRTPSPFDPDSPSTNPMASGDEQSH